MSGLIHIPRPRPVTHDCAESAGLERACPGRARQNHFPARRGLCHGRAPARRHPPPRSFRHLLPGVTSHILVLLSLSVPGMILGDTALSLLGLGLTPPVVSWGAAPGLHARSNP